ncbi:MAG: fibronectin type III domain-containing protein [Lachnospiraceae bacterium]|nr:fibronectin type III domain-containing protein [Lachnospiraceae bacterium]
MKKVRRRLSALSIVLFLILGMMDTSVLYAAEESAVAVQETEIADEGETDVDMAQEDLDVADDEFETDDEGNEANENLAEQEEDSEVDETEEDSESADTDEGSNTIDSEEATQEESAEQEETIISDEMPVGEQDLSEQTEVESSESEEVDESQEEASDDAADTLNIAGYNDFANAYSIKVNTLISDSLLNSNNSNVYKFEISSPGYVGFTFKHEYVDSGSNFWKLRLFSSNDLNNSLLDRYYQGNELNELTSDGTGLRAGTYYLVIEHYYYSDAQYQFKVTYNQSPNYEKEDNDTYVSATDIDLNTYYKGNIMSGADLDYYRFKLTSPGYISFSFSHDFVDSSSNHWILELYSQDDVNKCLVKRYYQGNELKTVTYDGTGLPAGTYYIKMEKYYHSTGGYQFKVNYTKSGAWEKELNDSAAISNVIGLNALYYGNLREGDDLDYYKISLNSTTKIQVQFAHDFVNSVSTHWILHIFSSGDLNNALSTFRYIGNEKKTLTSPALTLGKGTYYIRINDYYHSTVPYRFKIMTAKLSQSLKVSYPSSLVKGKSGQIKVSGNKGSLSYTSSKSAVVSVSSNGKLTAKSVGKVNVVIKAAATGNYLSASKTISITVIPSGTSLSSLRNGATRKMIVKWKKNSTVSGYEIQYSTSSSFKSGNKKATVSRASTVSKTIGSLSKGKTYYVRIRTYKTVGGKKYYSSWSGAKKVKISR